MNQENLKPSNLMVGDYLFGQPNNRIVRVIELKEDNDIVCDKRCYDLEPVPITPEILEKNGFCKPSPSCIFISDGILCRVDFNESGCEKILIMEMESMNVSFESYKLKYLHQLQQAMRLCGIKKEIKL